MNGRILGAVLGAALLFAGAALWLARRPTGSAPIAPILAPGTLRLDWSARTAPDARYRIEVRVDGSVGLVDTAAGGAGLLSVRRDLSVPAGTHSVNVSMTRLAAPAGGADSASPPSAPPDTLAYSGLVTLAPGEVVLVNYEPERRRLMVHRPRGTP